MPQTLDAGVARHSPSSEFMHLVDVEKEHLNDFNDVVAFLEQHLDDIINEVHGFDKLLLDDGKTQLNAPPAPEPGDSHGALLLRTLSEKEGPTPGITLKREFKVHDCGVDPDNSALHRVEIREDTVAAPAVEGQPPVYKENVVTVSIDRSKAKK